MGMFSSAPPRLPASGPEYTQGYLNGLLNILSLYFARLNAVQQISVASLNIDIDTLPTEADVASLRAGDVYRDSAASNVLKVKV